MSRKLTISSVRGGSLDLLHDEHFWLTNFSAETQSSTAISSATLAGFDGDIITNIQAQPRTAELELYIKSGVDVEAAKRHILQVIKPKQLCTFRLQRDERDMVLQGYVEAIDMPRYQNGIVLLVTFHCSQPYWEDAEEIIRTLTNVDNLHYFTAEEDMLFLPEAGIPFGVFNFARQKTYTNSGDTAVGMEIRITAVADVTNPIIYASDGTYIGVNTTMKAHDVISITTHKGNKTATKNGENILDTIMDGSTWLQMLTGDNTFNANSDDEETDNLYYELIFKQRYV